MALQPQSFPVPLYGGLDLKVDPKFVAPDKNLTMQNVRFPEVRRTEKRYGQSVLSNSVPSTSTFIQTGKALGVFRNELLAYDGTALYGYSEAAGNWQSRGNLTEVLVDVQNISAGINSAVDVSSGSNGTVEVYAWSDTDGSVYYSARDTITNSFYQQNVLAGVGRAPQVVLTTNFAYIFVLNGSNLSAKRLLLNNLGGGIVNSTTLAINVLSGSCPAAVFSKNADYPYIWVCYINSGGAFGTNFAVYSESLALQGSSSDNITELDCFISVSPNTIADGADDLVYVALQNRTIPDINRVTVNAFNPSTGAFVNSVTSALPSVPLGAADNLGTGVAINVRENLAYAAASWSTSGFAAKPWTAVLVVDGTGSDSWNTNYLFGLHVASQMASRTEGCYWAASSPTTTILSTASQQPTYYMCGVTATAPNPTILNRYYSQQAFLGGGNAPQVSVLEDGSLFLGQPYRAVLRADEGGTLFTAQYIMGTTLEFPAASGLQVIPFNGIALINCGLTYDYDGTQLVENGFWEFPEGVSAVSDTAGDDFQYQYYITYEWTNSQGAVTYSAPSYAVILNTDAAIGTSTTTLTIPYTTLTLKDNVKVCIYRTVANSSSPAYKIATVANLTDGTGTFTYNDSTTDAVASSGQRLYAPADFSAEIENEPAPSFKYMVATKTRVFGIPQDNSYSIWYSKPAAPGRPADFALAQFIPIETAGGSLTGLSVLDTQAVVFKTQRIYYLPGDGPNAGGQPYNAFPSSLQLIASTTGCTSNQSVLVTAEGLYFQSLTGLTQLSRSLQINPNFGMPVQPLIQSLTLTGAQAVTAQNQLRWVSASGTAVIYDYVVQRWSTYTNYASVGYQPFGATFARLRTDGRVWYEDTSLHTDNGSPVIMTVETAWLKPAQMAQGFAAVWYAEILGDYISAHNLVIEVAYDYLDLAADVVTWDATTNGNFGFYGSGSPYGSDPYYGSSSSTPIFSTAYQIRYASKRQTCQAVKFKIYDNTTTGASCALNEITLQLGVIGGIKRVPEGQQV